MHHHLVVVDDPGALVAPALDGDDEDGFAEAGRHFGAPGDGAARQ